MVSASRNPSEPSSFADTREPYSGQAEDGRDYAPANILATAFPAAAATKQRTNVVPT